MSKFFFKPKEFVSQTENSAWVSSLNTMYCSQAQKPWSALYRVKLTYLITGGVGGAGEDPPTYEMRAFFLRYVPDTNCAVFEQFPIKWS